MDGSDKEENGKVIRKSVTADTQEEVKATDKNFIRQSKIPNRLIRDFFL